MNTLPLTDPLTHSLTDSISAVPEISDIVPDSLADALPKKKKRRPTGKIFGLPQAQKDLINQMLDDGKSYRVIEEEMAKLGVELNGENLSNWFTGPYQEYVRNRQWREDLLTLAQSAPTLDDLPFGQRFQESLVQLAFVDIFRALRDPETRTDRLNHIRILNALARLNREALSVRKYNELRADKTATTQPIGATRAPTAEEICNSFLTGFEKVTGIKPADGPIGPDLNVLLGLDPDNSSSAPASSLAAPEHRAGGPALHSASDEGGSASCSSSPQPDLSRRSSERRSEGLTADSPGSQSAETPGNVPKDPLHPDLSRRSSERRPEGMPEPPDRAPSPAPSTPSQHDAANGNGQPRAQSGFQSKTEIQKPKINPSNSSPSQLSTTSAPELCYSCAVPLPPLKPDGTRPSPSCPGCHIHLHPPGTTYDHCPSCNAYQAISTSGERYSKECDRCHQVLPPVGHRYTAECPSCGLGLNNFTRDGARISERCPDCRTLVPLHEPIPPLSQTSSSTLSETLSNTTSPPDSAGPPALAA